MDRTDGAVADAADGSADGGGADDRTYGAYGTDGA